MMAYSEDHIALAAEYALGTLDADERAQVETMMAVDTEFTAYRPCLGIPPRRAEPDGRIGRAAADRLGEHQGRDRTFHRAAGAAGAPRGAARRRRSARRPKRRPNRWLRRWRPVVADHSNVIQLSGRARRWRNVASFATAIAAALIAMLAMQVYQPDLLPNVLRPKVRIQTVEVKTPAPPPAPSAQYVALLQRDGGSPAFILTVDAATRNFTVRKVGADAEPGKSFELWLISDKLPQPRSLGVIGGSDFTARPVLAGYDASTINAATYAVTVEPAGGSPSGQPTSAPIYTGKLIETVPSTATPR